MIYLNKKVMKKFDELCLEGQDQEANVENQSGVENRPFCQTKSEKSLATAPNTKDESQNPTSSIFNRSMKRVNIYTNIIVPDDSTQHRNAETVCFTVTVCGSSCSSGQPVRAIPSNDSSRCLRNSTDGTAGLTRSAWSGTRNGTNQTHVIQHCTRKGRDLR